MAKHGKLHTYLEYAPVKLVLMTLGRLPPRTAYRVGQSMGKIGYLLAADLRRTGAINLRLAFPEKTDEERAALLRECFDSLGRELGLFSQMASRSREELKQLIEPQGWENLENARAERGERFDLLHRSPRRVGDDEFRHLASRLSVNISRTQARQSENRTTCRSKFARSLAIKRSTNYRRRVRWSKFFAPVNRRWDC